MLCNMLVIGQQGYGYEGANSTEHLHLKILTKTSIMKKD